MAQAQQAFDTHFESTASQQAREASTILINRNLFSSYYLGTLFDKTVRAQQGETGTRMPRSIRQRLQTRWDKYTPTLGSSTGYGRTREAWLETLMIALGYEPLDQARAEDFKETTLPDGYFLYLPTDPGLVNTERGEMIARRKGAEGKGAVYDRISSSIPDIADTDQPTAVPLFDTSEADTIAEPDDVLAPEDEGKDAVILISLLSWGTDFDRPFASRMRRSDVPHKLMGRLLASGGPARWGILCNGRRIRLLKRDVVAGRQQYFEVDLEALFDNRNEQDAHLKEQGFDTFWTLFRAQAFQPGADGRCLLDILEQESRKHAEGVSARLKISVFQALDTLMSELVNRARTLSTRPVIQEDTELDPRAQAHQQRTRELAEQALKDLPTLYTQSLVYLYRLLFVLYAESRNLLPVDNAVYRDAYSLEPLRTEIELPGVETRYRPDSFRLWETVQALFRLIHRGCNTTQLVVPAYNGNLFDPQSVSLLHTIRISDDALYRLLLPLSVTPPTKDRGRERIDYRDMGVEQLGAVYEGLLEFEPRVASEPMVEVRYKDVRVIIPKREQRDYKVERDIESGQFYLGRGAGRKTSGSYYTPQPLVDFLVERTLKPLVQGKKPEEILELKVVDPAMGSGAFLVGACLYLADAYARAVREQERLNGNRHTLLPDTSEASPQAGARFISPLATSQTVIGESAEEEAEITVQEAEEDGELLEDATRPYRRLVAERCLYGVDLNPMAVELAKVSLWLTTLAGDKPLTFLDANLRCGNSLIGAPLQRAGQGQENIYTIYTIHPEANKRLAKERGDAHASRGNKRGKASLWDEEEEEKQYTIFDETNDVKDTVPTLVDHRCMIAEQPSDTVENVHAKAAIFQQEIVNNEKRQMLERICNLWVATWFWKQSSQKKKPTDADWVPPLDGQIYRELVSYIREQFHEGLGQFVKIDPRSYFAEVEKVVKEVRPFHWELEFPEIYFEPDGKPRTNPGFTAVLGNPPWDIIKPNSREFFTAFDPSFRELERIQADQRQEELLKEKDIQVEWDDYVRNLDGQVSYTRLSDLYSYQSDMIDGKQTGGDANTYKLFLERTYNLLRQGGNCGIIVPSGLYTDQGCTGLRKLFLKRAQISYLYCFENRRGIFPIDSRFKFVLFGMRRIATEDMFDAAFMLHDMEVLSAPETHSINVPAQLITRLSPNTLSIMEFRSQRDVDIVSEIYCNRPLLGERIDQTWDIDLAREFHMTDDRYLFNNTSLGWILYEGKLIHQYTHRFSEPHYWVEPEKGREELARMEIQRVEEELDTLALKQSLIRKVATRKERVKNLLASYGRGPLTVDDVKIAPEAPRLSFRTIARNTDERTIISTILPSAVFAGNSLAYVNPWKFDIQQALNQLHDIKSCYKLSLPLSVLAYLCGAFNSFVLDYVIRFKVSANVNMFYIYQLPAPRLTPDDPHCQAIAHRVAKLVCIGPECDELRRELLGDVNAHVATIQDERQKLQNEIDALVAHLYGLRREDLEHILYAPYTFPLVKAAVKDGVMAAFGRVEDLLEREV